MPDKDVAPPPATPAAAPAVLERGAPPTPGGLWGALIRYQAIVVPVVGLVVAFVVGALLIRQQGVNPTYAYKTLFQSALFTRDGLNQTLQRTTPLIFTGLAVAVPLRVGLFNIGAQGQFIFGALAAAVVGYKLHSAPGIVIILVALLCGLLAGAMWASIAGFLKTSRGVHEVISTIMLNSIAVNIIDYLINNPFKEKGQAIPRTPQIAPQAFLNDMGIVPIGFPIAVILAVGTAWMLRRTTLGFQFETVGRNKAAAGYAGIKINKMILLAMALAGAFAGLAGGIETLGDIHRYESGFNANLGFDGITIALLARSNPVATIPAAFLVGALRAGASALQFDTGIQPEVVDMLLAITLLFVSLPLVAKLIFRRYAAKGSALTSGWGS